MYWLGKYKRGWAQIARATACHDIPETNRTINKEATVRLANRRLPVDFKALIRRRSQLALMNANDDSLSVRTASVSGSDAEGRPYGVHQFAKPAFFIWPRLNCGHYFLEVSRANGGSVDKISSLWQTGHGKCGAATVLTDASASSRASAS